MTDDMHSVMHSSVTDSVKELAAHPTLNVGVSVPKGGLAIQKSVKIVEEKAVRTGTV